MVAAPLLATSAEKVMRGKTFYRTLLIWPYAIALAVVGMLFLFMFNPAMGSFAYMLRRNGAPNGPTRDILSGFLSTDENLPMDVPSAWRSARTADRC